MNLSKLLIIATGTKPESGTISGTCVLCNVKTAEGHRVKDIFSGNFMGWSYLFSGNCVCPNCAFLFSDQSFRKHSWCASGAGFEIFKNEDAREHLFNPPKPPFFIHIAKMGQKQPWLSCLHRVSGNCNRYFFTHENYAIPLRFDHEEAKNYIELAEKLLIAGVTKTELIFGQFRIKTWEKAEAAGFQESLHQASLYTKIPLWEVMVDVVRVEKPSSDDVGAGIEVGGTLGLGL